ncbi:hypothetical protein AB205_0152460 [Aquarana catesbeiana]|uniref:Uncharacterized protein n=1 Tax=Aquarana catesbeiana TaxID=8400 RepID=A0A2G9RBV0_AQUCT|nr:hypothetical protein AB205_0152460 [Aquarana catesbeiana]
MCYQRNSIKVMCCCAWTILGSQLKSTRNVSGQEYQLTLW